MAEYSQQTKSVCTNTNDPTCSNSQAQFNDLNALHAQVRANGKYDVPPNPPLTTPKQAVIVDGFTSLQSMYTGLFAVAALFIIYGLVAKGQKY